MTLEGPIRQVETARAELNKIASSADGWSDKQRHTFDSQRMKPLDMAGARLLTALQKAQEKCAQAERLLSGR
jgi:hypothetical protein